MGHVARLSRQSAVTVNGSVIRGGHFRVEIDRGPCALPLGGLRAMAASVRSAPPARRVVGQGAAPLDGLKILAMPSSNYHAMVQCILLCLFGFLTDIETLLRSTKRYVRRRRSYADLAAAALSLDTHARDEHPAAGCGGDVQR